VAWSIEYTNETVFITNWASRQGGEEAARQQETRQGLAYQSMVWMSVEPKGPWPRMARTDMNMSDEISVVRKQG